MRKYYQIPVWKKAPFLRLLIPVITGILFQFYLGVALSSLFFSGICFAILLLAFFFLPEVMRFRLRTLQGILLFFLLVLSGAAMVWKQDARNHNDWYGKYDTQNHLIVATIAEPLQEKAKSYKAIVSADAIIENGKELKTSGKFLAYFSKDSTSKKLKYGDRVIVNKSLSPIFNSGNPAAFNYQQYCAFRQLYHQVFLNQTDWILLPSKNINHWQALIFNVRGKIVETLDRYLGKNEESSIAKALLIGYNVDLDKDLVQAYSNAGVVHIIAISGLHIGIVYAILFWIFSAMPVAKKSKRLRLLFTLSGLWFFTFITVASPSEVRATLMFYIILIGSAIDKKGSVYNSLSASAFFLLIYNPFFLWDVGFELSYLAVAGIVIAQKPILNWLYFKNKCLQRGWQLIAVSLSAQLFTFPLCLYYFHQFPLLFLFANLIAIPVSSVILGGCIILIGIAFIPVAAFYFAKIIFVLIWFLNHTVLFFDSIPYTLWSGISISTAETFLLYAFIACFVFSFKQKNKKIFQSGVAFFLCFLVSKTAREWNLYQQKKIIVYNIPRHNAIEFIDRNNYFYSGDEEVIHNKLLYDYNIKPAHTAFQLKNFPAQTPGLFFKDHFFQFYDTRILCIDSSFHTFQPYEKTDLNYILISKNPEIKIEEITKLFHCNHFIFDASNSAWKIRAWKKECEELHLHFHSVSEQGAYVINL
jgi:competence protein ComEC